MRIKTIIKSFIISMLFFYVVLIAGKVYSETFDISGNATDSNNSIDINQKDSSTVNQSNSANVNNSVNANSDTGGNSINDGVGGGSIKTGDASSNVNIDNQFNTNKADVKCKNCLTPTPTPKPFPTPTHPVGGPIDDPGSPSSGSSGSGSSGNGGSGGGNGGAASGQGGAVLGLSTTSGETSLLKLIPGFISIFFGAGLIKKRV